VYAHASTCTRLCAPLSTCVRVCALLCTNACVLHRACACVSVHPPVVSREHWGAAIDWVHGVLKSHQTLPCLVPKLSTTTHFPAHPPCPRRQEAFLPDPGTSRAVPDWGRAIFSPLAVCMRPDSDQALAGFIKYCVALTRAHLMVSASPGGGTCRGHGVRVASDIVDAL
jgi:hypothetical protein